MGIFFTSSKPVLPEIRDSIEDALLVNPQTLGTLPLGTSQQEAAKRSIQLYKSVSPQLNWKRVLVAAVIAVALLIAAIWTAKDGLPDISKDLMTSFQAYSGLIVGWLGGEAQKAIS